MTPLRERIEGLRRFTAQKVAVVGDELAGRRMPLYLDRSAVLAALDEPWIDEPERGDWWVSIAPEKRLSNNGLVSFPAVVSCAVLGVRDAFGMVVKYTGGRDLWPLDQEWFKGAKWQRRTTPPDPFADKSEDKDR